MKILAKVSALIALLLGSLPLQAEASSLPTHIVQRGETVFSIARRYGLDVDWLLDANDIADPQRIHSGLVLRLDGTQAAEPAADAAPPPLASAPPASVPTLQRAVHVVQPGDFLTQLGLEYQVSWIALARVNQLSAPYTLYEGQRLLLPNRADEQRHDPEYAAWKWLDIIARQPGARVGIGREIVVVLSTQAAYAYEDGILQKAVRVSSGKPSTPTVEGAYEVWLKRRSQTMSGPGYTLDNVEWVVYFHEEYAIHGTYWHINFGQPMSRGCVNMRNEDARWFYEFATVGTPVFVGG